jgi:DNA mismatch endonuclease (patch repair protein)
MALIGGRDTRPELVVRGLLHAAGVGYRLHVAGLVGRPDIVLRSRKSVIFVHGCFWHRHRCRKGRSMPSTNSGFWREKFARNVLRDRSALRALRAGGWRALVVWECETRDVPGLRQKLKRFLQRREQKDKKG